MTLLVAAPIANRPWAVDPWVRNLAEQTVPPDEILLVHGGRKHDETWAAIDEAARAYGLPIHRLRAADNRVHNRNNDPERYRTLAACRNQMLAFATIALDHDLLFSLDTDIMLEDPTIIERLIALRTELDLDVISPLVYLHPDMAWTYNGGWLSRRAPARDLGPESAATWPWHRPSEIPWKHDIGHRVLSIDVPMAAILMGQSVFTQCRYGHHESGEDISFALSLARNGARCGLAMDVQAKHLWDEKALTPT
jgi:hypothetical protein